MDIFNIKSKLKDRFITPELRGAIDEHQIMNSLTMRNAYGNKGKTILNVNVPTANGHTTKIDAVTVIRKGILVVNVVNQNGFIFGDDTSKNWSASTYFGTDSTLKSASKSISFKNPVLENAFDMHALRVLLGKDVDMYSFIVFPNDAEFKDIHLEKTKCCICHIRNLSGHISRICQLVKNSMTDQDVEDIYNKLLPLADYSEPTKGVTNK